MAKAPSRAAIVVRCTSRQHQVKLDPSRFWRRAACPVCRTEVDRWRVQRATGWLAQRVEGSRPTLLPSEWRKWVALAVTLYAATALLIAFIVRGAGDRNALGMLLLFAPRHLLVLPGVLLAPLALASSYRMGGIALLALLTAAFPLGMFEVPWPRSVRAEPPVIRLVTYNTDGHHSTAWRLRSDLDLWDADVILLQDCRAETADSARALVEWHLQITSEFCVLSRLPILEVEEMPPPMDLSSPMKGQLGRALRFRVSTEFGPLAVNTIHLGSPREALWAARNLDFSGLTENIELRSRDSRIASAWTQSQDSLAVVAGDFNLPAGSAILARDWGHFRNAFSDVGLGFGHTMFAGRHAIRIDHVLLSPALAAKSARVLRGYPSEHQPVLVEFGRRE